jgi:hypothetical protein
VTDPLSHAGKARSAPHVHESISVMEVFMDETTNMLYVMAFAVRAAIEYDHELLEARTQVCPRTLFIEHWDETSDLVPEGEEK